ncbi:MAG: DUF2147 domain-containing protein [Gammaproteobacteria bacterium]|nr:DUF2147 domain-containing protein [Gammaproteobacteria bacterium]
MKLSGNTRTVIAPSGTGKLSFRVLVTTIAASVSVFAHANPLTGSWLTEDGNSVVSIGVCSDAIDRFCGYLVRFPSTGSTALDRAMCRFRLLGGLRLTGDDLADGWFFDVESGNAYSLTIRAGESQGTLDLRLFTQVELFGKTIHWTRSETPVMPVDDKQQSTTCTF